MCKREMSTLSNFSINVLFSELNLNKEMSPVIVNKQLHQWDIMLKGLILGNSNLAVIASLQREYLRHSKAA